MITSAVDAPEPQPPPSLYRAAPKRGAYDIQRVRTFADLEKIHFVDGMAAVEAPIDVVRAIRYKNHERQPSERLDAVVRSIRRDGYKPLSPIIARIGQKGRWVIVDGGHRLTAALHVADEFWCNLFAPKVGNLYFLLFETERSWSKLKHHVAPGVEEPAAPQSPAAPPPE